MPWSDTLDQPRATDALQRALASGRVPHAVLFHGPAGTGKLATALAFAQALQCERRGTPGGPKGDACGTCLPCTKVARMLHPDVRLYLPFPRTSKAPKDDRPADYAERVRLVGTDPHGAYDYRSRAKLDGEAPSNKQVQHRRVPIEQVFRPDMTKHPVEGRHVVGILTDADRIRTEAANSILKLLEEPAPRVVLVLLAERLRNVLPTIVSRCQRVRFDPLAPEAIERALQAREGVDAQASGVAARMADGSYTRARQLVGSEELGELRGLAVDFVRQSYLGRAGGLMPIVDKVSGLGREGAKAWLALVHSWIRDLVLARAAGSAAPLVNVDQTEAIRKFVQHVPDADLDAMASQVEDALRLVTGNAPLALVAVTLAYAMRDAMHGRPRPQLALPLDAA